MREFLNVTVLNFKISKFLGRDVNKDSRLQDKDKDNTRI